ncbi:hypothetical protein MP638_006429 [Amoeboaphelidium occidentale]|nr:hypothetical protein MP638_006429 [Amoeboaphelidium occidentale]
MRNDYDSLNTRDASGTTMITFSQEKITEWEKKGLLLFRNCLSYATHSDYRINILDQLKSFWRFLDWKSWNNVSSAGSAKAYVFSYDMLDNHNHYWNRRNPKLSLRANLEFRSSLITSWVHEISDSLFQKLIKSNKIECDSLLLIGANLNACGNAGLVLHRDLVKNEGYGDVIFNLVLTGGAFVVLAESVSNDKSNERVWLGPGDAYVICNKARFEYYHGIETVGANKRKILERNEGVEEVGFMPNNIRLSLTLRYFYNREKKLHERFDIDLK